MNIYARDQRLHDLLRAAMYGGVVRYRGRLIIDGADANYLQQLAVSVLTEKGWIAWLDPPSADLPESCILTETGNETFDTWHRALWGPPTQSSTWLIPTCLNDLGLSDTEIAEIRTGFAELDRKKGNRP